MLVNSVLEDFKARKCFSFYCNMCNGIKWARKEHLNQSP